MNLAQARRIALALPEVTEAPHFHYSSFRVRGRIFATFPPAGGFLNILVDEDQRELAPAVEAGFLEPLTWGRKVVGLRVSLAKARAAWVRELLQHAWSLKAPKRLAATLPARSRKGGSSSSRKR